MPRTDLESDHDDLSLAHEQSYRVDEAEDWVSEPSTQGEALDDIAGGRAGVAYISAVAPSTPAVGQVWLDSGTSGTPSTSFLTVVTIAANTLLDNDDVVVLCNAAGGAITVTLPAAANSTSKRYFIKKIDSSANAVTVDANGAETIDDVTTKIIASQYDCLAIVCDGTEWWII